MRLTATLCCVTFRAVDDRRRVTNQRVRSNMNISSITSSSVTSSIAATSPTEIGSPPTEASASGAGPDGARISKMGELMSKLQDLEASDPDKAKQVLAKIAGDLRSQAEQTGDD